MNLPWCVCPILSLVLSQQLWECIWLVKPKSQTESCTQGVWEMQILALQLLCYKGVYKKKRGGNKCAVNPQILPYLCKMVCWELWVWDCHLESSPNLYHSHCPSRDYPNKWFSVLLDSMPFFSRRSFVTSALMIWNEIHDSYNFPTNAITKKSTYAHVQCSIMYNSQDMHAT